MASLVVTSASLDAILQRTTASIGTLTLRQETMHRVDQNLQDPARRVDDSNIAAVAQLLVGEVIIGEETAVAFHESGLRAMIGLRGVLSQLGINGHLASMVSWSSLGFAISREGKASDIYLEYCASRSSRFYPPAARIPESPLYRPQSQFETLRSSHNCNGTILQLLADIHLMTELLLQPVSYASTYVCETSANVELLRQETLLATHGICSLCIVKSPK
jgi:hypothetical protein